MSEENIQSLRRAIDAFNQRDIDAYLALCDPDLEFIPRVLEMEGGGSYRGYDGVRSWWESLFAVFPDFRLEIEEARDLGDVTVARVRMSGQGVESDMPTEATAWLVTESRHNRTTWWRNCGSEAEALEAAGLRA